MPKCRCFTVIRSLAGLKLFIAAAFLNIASNALAQSSVLGSSPETTPPVHVSQGATPLVLLTMARDHSLFFGAYNDLTDLDGSGAIVFNFKPTFEYIGLFNSAYCYKYNGVKDSTLNGKDSYFSPGGLANDLGAMQYPGGCNNSGDPLVKWSGNWLNYVTTSRIDALRVALYGGYRVIDKDGTTPGPNTLLRRSYIPQDGHTWAKSYTNIAINGYDITQYTPYSMPTSSPVQLQHFFGNLTTTVIRDVSLTKPYVSNSNGIKTITYPGGRQITGQDDFVAGHPTQWVLNAPDVGINCASLSNCSDYPPVMRVVVNAGSRVWRWAASSQPVLDYHPYPIGWNPRAFIYPNRGNYEGYGNLYGSLSTYVNPQPDYPTDFTVQVEVCVGDYIRGCKKYGSNSNNIKPVGVLHDYGENGSMRFGLLTGSYDKNLSGGRIRKNIGSFGDEIIPETGQFAYKVPVNGNNNPFPNSIIRQIDNIRIRNFNNPTSGHVLPDYGDGLWANNFVYKNLYSTSTKGDGPEGMYADWGNPIAEMMYEGLRYFKGLTPSSAFAGDANSDFTEDTAVGLSHPVWSDPYSDQTQWCAKPNMLVVSSPYTSSDSDQLPGASFSIGAGNGGALGSALQNAQGVALDVSDMTDRVGEGENLKNVNKFIGEISTAATDFSPTLKRIPTLSKVRGLAPNYPESEGGFYAAGVAYYGKSNPLRSVNGKNIPVTDTYVMMLPSPDATIQVPFPDGRKMTIQPFAKSIDMTDVDNIKAAKGQYQASNQIVGIYVTEAITTPGAYSLKFYVNFEAQSSGGDFEMDAVGYYEISAGSDSVSVMVTDSANDAQGRYIGQNLGYIINGTDGHDGIYLVVQDRYIDPAKDNTKKNVSYFLNVPSPEGFTKYWAGACDPDIPSNHANEDRCKVLPNKDGGAKGASSTMVFGVAAAGSPSPTLQHPLWYAARWGGYIGTVPPTAPLPDGQDPENFTQVANPAKLKDAFYKMFQNVLDTSATQGSVVSNSQQQTSSSQLYTSSFNPATLYGELTATPFTVTQAAPSDVVTYGAEKTASAKMPSAANRKIYFRDSTQSPRSGDLKEFIFANVNGPTGYPGALANQDMVDYLRGDRYKEMQYNGLYRNRQTVLGTTVNSTPLYSPDTRMVYLGANDGMVHAFDATDLTERFAFIPTSVLTTRASPVDAAKPSLSAWGSLTTKIAAHRFFVDGNLAITDVNTPDPGDASGYNYLVGFLGRGGKGLFGLPVKPYDASTVGVKTNGGVWEMDATNDPHMGYLLGKPIMGRLSDGTNVVIFGNGYNSARQQAVLYVVRARDGVLMAKYITCAGDTAEDNCVSPYRETGKPNGMATPGVMLRAGYIYFAYAGDYLGNVWRFDLRALSSALPLPQIYYPDNIYPPRIKKAFTARSSAGAVQHIVAPIISEHSYDSTDPFTNFKQYVWFGTGSDLTTADLSNTTVTQSMYGLMIEETTPPDRSTNLVRRDVLGSGTYTGYKSAGGTLPVRAFSSPAGGTEMQDKKGWYMDWATPAGGGIAPVEQVFTAAAFRSSTTPAIVVSSAISTSNSCVSTGAGYLNAMDAYSGGSLPSSYFDINRNGMRDETFTDAGGVQRQVSSIDFGIGAIGGVGFSGANVIAQGAGANAGTTRDNLADVGILITPKVSRRTSWREITGAER